MLPVVAPESVVAKAFRANISVNTSTAKLWLVLFAEEVIAVLKADLNADANVTLEFQGVFSDGATGHINRFVSENSMTLNFKISDWERAVAGRKAINANGLSFTRLRSEVTLTPDQSLYARHGSLSVCRPFGGGQAIYRRV